ncbi:MAG: DUF599 domain-containing protein [Hyphomicrobiales bacterium]
MTGIFSNADVVSLVFFILAWLLYHFAVESEFFGKKSLNSLMHQFRGAWMANMLGRDERIVDTQIMNSLQNGTAFFASTSLFAIGGSLALLRATDDVLKVFSDLPLGLNTSRVLWEIKVSGIVVIFVYAFFKFAWAYRLFNYSAILIGATARFHDRSKEDAISIKRALADLLTDAGTQFNRGQRAFFFALAYVGWFVSPAVFIIATATSVSIMLQRQFLSKSRNAVSGLIRTQLSTERKVD